MFHPLNEVLRWLGGFVLRDERPSHGEVEDQLAQTVDGPGVTAKTFRTWNATVPAADGLAAASEHVDTPTTRDLNDVIDSVADHLGNTRAVCRNSYVHPAVIENYLQGTLPQGWQRPVGAKPAGLTVIERKTLRLLRRGCSRWPSTGDDVALVGSGTAPTERR